MIDILKLFLFRETDFMQPFTGEVYQTQGRKIQVKVTHVEWHLHIIIIYRV
jgi:hypothetical protein